MIIKAPAWRIEEAVRMSLTPDLLQPRQRRLLAPGDHPTTGHCYVAAEAAFHLVGGKGEGWTPMVISLPGNTHWFIKHKDGRVIDPTKEQFGSRRPPYRRARGSGFLTKQPSRRAEIVIARTASLLSVPGPLGSR